MAEVADSHCFRGLRSAEDKTQNAGIEGPEMPANMLFNMC